MMSNPKNKIDGILLLHKPEGITSNKALQKVKGLFGAKKAGHTGSLDPLATGMLPICFGEATKVCQYLLDADKCYETTGLLGSKTDTSDAMGQVIATVEDVNVSEEELKNAISLYVGHIKQIPSMFSALKYQGRPLYKLAREGKKIERQARDILISQLELLQFDGYSFSLRVNCSKGTYIRNLVEDIGDTLNVGAHVTRLHRLYTSGFEERTMYSLEQLEAMSMVERMQCLIPMDQAIVHLDDLQLCIEDVLALRQGKIIYNKTSHATGSCLRLYDDKAQFIGIGEQFTNGEIKAKRLLSFDIVE